MNWINTLKPTAKRIAPRVVQSIRNIRYKIRVPARMVTSHQRMDPKLIIIGAQKAGTGSLFHWLGQHPAMHPSFKKEVHFFDGGIGTWRDNYQRGLHWYKAHFPLKKKVLTNNVAFEASPMYLFHPECAARIKTHYPNIKLVVLLRDPVERAISHYYHVCRRGGEHLSLMDALLAEEERLVAIGGNHQYRTQAFADWSYKARGMYAKQLRTYLQHFDRSQILIQQSETLFADPRMHLAEIFQFANVNPDFVPNNINARNVGSRQSLDPHVYSYLKECFHDSNEELFDLLGVRFFH
jgi:hypothetical protein